MRTKRSKACKPLPAAGGQKCHHCHRPAGRAGHRGHRAPENVSVSAADAPPFARIHTALALPGHTPCVATQRPLLPGGRRDFTGGTSEAHVCLHLLGERKKLQTLRHALSSRGGVLCEAVSHPGRASAGAGRLGELTEDPIAGSATHSSVHR